MSRAESELSRGAVAVSATNKYQLWTVMELEKLVTSLSPGLAGLATESTLLNILNNMIASQDVEILLVRDTGNADKVVQQIREYDQGTGLWTTRYEDVNGNPYVPVGTLEYLDPSAVLNLVLSELVSLNTTDFATQTTLEAIRVLMVALDAKDYATETTLTAFAAKLNTLGQKASAASAPVVLSTEQEVILNAIKTAVENLDIDVDGLATEVTLEAIRVLTVGIDNVLDAIKLDTANLDVALSTRASEATAAAIETLVTTSNSLLTDIKANTEPALLQSCAHVDLSNTSGVFGAGSRAFSIVIESGTASIGGLTKSAPYGVSFSADSNGTLGGITYDATIDPTAIVTAVRVQ